MIAHMDGKLLCVSLPGLLRQMDGPALKEVIDYLATEEEVITQVMNQVLHGSTAENSHGIKDVPAQPEPTSAIDQARRHIAVHSDRIANEVISELNDSLKQSKEELAKVNAAYVALEQRFKSHLSAR